MSHLWNVCALALGIKLPPMIRAHNITRAADVAITQGRHPADHNAPSATWDEEPGALSSYLPTQE